MVINCIGTSLVHGCKSQMIMIYQICQNFLSTWLDVVTDWLDNQKCSVSYIREWGPRWKKHLILGWDDHTHTARHTIATGLTYAYVTGFGKTDHNVNVTIDISRKTDLKYWSHHGSLVLDCSYARFAVWLEQCFG